MKYNPPDIMNEEGQEGSMFHPEKVPVTETTKFMRWGTQVEKDDIVDEHFIGRHKNLFAIVNKWMPLANYQKEKYQKQIEQIRRFEISLLEEVDLGFDAEEVVINTIGDAQYSRGREGFYTKEQSMLRYKIKQEEVEQKKEGRLGFFKNREPKKSVDHEVSW